MRGSSAESPHFHGNGNDLVIYRASEPCLEDRRNKYMQQKLCQQLDKGMMLLLTPSVWVWGDSVGMQVVQYGPLAC